eukprot:gene18956-20862_t
MNNEASIDAKLKDEQTKAINQSTSLIEKWENLLKEYQNLKAKLSTLPQKVEHKMMVPIGSVGLFPGKLIHTNEINVLLGDNWFVKRSAHQASEIVDRRLSILEKKLEDAKKEVQFINSQKNLTENLMAEQKGSDIVEIREEEEMATVSKVGRRIAHASTHKVTPRKVRKFDKKTTQQAGETFLSSDKKDDDFDKLFARLDQLELEEQLLENKSKDNEREKCKQQTQTQDLAEGCQANRREAKGSSKNSCVHFQDIENKDKFEISDEDNSLKGQDTNLITFNHTREIQNENLSSGSVGDADITSDRIILSPADIYDYFMKPVTAAAETEEKPLKSILKKERKHSNEDLKPKPILKYSPEHKQDSPSNEDALSHSNEEPKPILKPGPEAVSSLVLEKQAATSEIVTNASPQKKPMSRFKALRMKKQ